MLLCFRFYLPLILYIVFISYSICLVFTNSYSIWLVCLCVCWFFFIFFIFLFFICHLLVLFTTFQNIRSSILSFGGHIRNELYALNIILNAREILDLLLENCSSVHTYKKKKKLFFCSLFFNFCNSGCILKISIMTC